MSEVYNELTGTNRQANAAENAANAQIAAARENRDIALRLAEASPSELRAYESNLSASERTLANAERMFASIDPAILEASNQILRILQGEQTSAGGVFESERERQRQSLVDNLRAQYGPGAEFTSLGRRALQDFDNQTSVSGVGVRQNDLATLGGIFGMGQTANTGIGQAASQVANAGSLFGNISTRKTNAATGTGTAVVDTAGGQFLGDMIRGQGQQQLFNLAATNGASFLGLMSGPSSVGSSTGVGGSGSPGFARMVNGI